MRAERLVALLFTLQSRRGATVAELAGALDVSERTMHRDLAALRSAGVPLWTEPGRHGGVRLVDGWRSQLDGLTAREAVALFAMGAPGALGELGLGTAVSAAHAKVSASLPAGLRGQAQQMAHRFHLDAPGWFGSHDDVEHLTTLARAVWNQRRVRVSYRRGEHTVERTLEPLGLVLKAGVWYLVAGVADSVRTYRVARIESGEELDSTFERPDDFDLPRWWRASSARFERSIHRLHARIRLSPEGRRRLPLFLDQEIALPALDDAVAPDSEGWTTVEVHLQREDIAVSQLLPLGPNVEVLAPHSLRVAFADTVRRMGLIHAAPAAPAAPDS
ncbi:YafY family transcriptional regulator [Spiractinospora alimapuensis]|uniref:helix-turn-helix transcriptional regulator n=1 Tax=Spiractinospora alimapuensis TaxID=2820884 RepID=UPI001F1C017E|nr:YafY family protein [Spiractinospora alimapuensis]QVQ49995.1 YafY family transcriptional regulator [Spiractinospora alimapuensis]